MTEITKYMYEKATGGTLSLKKALALLNENANIRTTADILADIANISKDDNATLQKVVVEKLFETDESQNRDSVRRKVNLWIKNNVLISREGGIQLGFAFSLSMRKTDELLMHVCEEGFHWRDPVELVYIYALEKGMSYREAKSLIESLESKGLLSVGRELQDVKKLAYTEIFKQKMTGIESEEELESFLRESALELGKLHNTAYSFFVEYLKILQRPEGDEGMVDGLFGGNRDDSVLYEITPYSIRDVLREYLFDALIPHAKREKGGKKEAKKNEEVFSALQRNIRQNWPDEFTLSKMQSRELDVTRKVLILLFLATYDEEFDEYDEYLIDEEDSENAFADMYASLSEVLDRCGFSPLDPRVPFDWMVLFCMCADESYLRDARVKYFLKNIFSPEPREESDS